MIFYILGVIFCVIGGGCLGYWTTSDEHDNMLIILAMVFVVIGLVLSVIGSMLGRKNAKPNRSVVNVPFSCDSYTAQQTIESLLVQKGFVKSMYGTQEVYRLGSGFWTGRKYTHVILKEDSMDLESWVCMGMGNRPNTEYPLDDKFIACVPKKQLKKAMNEIIQSFKEKTNVLVEETNKEE